jgi:Xaa-Pro aminopeptidase
MCFAGKPGLYIPGECGARVEACLHMTGQGLKLFPVGEIAGGADLKAVSGVDRGWPIRGA